LKTIWFDITNTPHVHFLLGVKSALEMIGEYEYKFTSREFSETNKLLRQKIGDDFSTIGGHYGKKKINKVIGLLGRFAQISRSVGDFDISISNGSESAIWLAFLKGKKSIAFGDNDTARQWTYGRFVSFAFFPDAIEKHILTRQGISEKRLYLYHGYKEDIYLAGYKPDHSFLEKLPFNEYVIVRPENLMANYIRNDNVKSITPELLKLLSDAGLNILYLPRYTSDHDYSKGIQNIYTPKEPLNGLDACYYATAVLTGAGTIAREAACMKVPAFSFYAGKHILAVDRQMIKEKMICFSRDANEIASLVKKISKNQPDFSRSLEVREDVGKKLSEVIKKFDLQ
jgi:uncharacterized protein